MKIYFQKFLTIVFISANALAQTHDPFKISQGSTPSCTALTKKQGQDQKGFMTPFQRSFPHPGLFKSLNGKEHKNANTWESASIVEEFYSFDGDVGRQQFGRIGEVKLEFCSHEKAVQYIEDNLYGKSFIDASPIEILYHLVKINKLAAFSCQSETSASKNQNGIFMLDMVALNAQIQFNKKLERPKNAILKSLINFFMPSYRFEFLIHFREDGILIRKSHGNGLSFHKVAETKDYFTQNSQHESLKIYTELADSIQKQLFESYSNAWTRTLMEILQNQPTTQLGRFVAQYYRLIQTTPQQIEANLLELIVQVQSLFHTDPLASAALAHMGFVDIHPFSDGNGRTARLFMNIILREASYPSVVMFSDAVYTEAVNLSLESRDTDLYKQYISNMLCSEASAEEDSYFKNGEIFFDIAKECHKKMKKVLKTQSPVKIKALADTCQAQFNDLLHKYKLVTPKTLKTSETLEVLEAEKDADGSEEL